MPVVDPSGAILGMVTESQLMAQMVKGKVSRTDPVSRCLYTKYTELACESTLGRLSRVLDKSHFALVTTKQRCYSSAGELVEKTQIFSIVTRIDLLNYIMSTESADTASPHGTVPPSPSGGRATAL